MDTEFDEVTVYLDNHEDTVDMIRCSNCGLYLSVDEDLEDYDRQRRTVKANADCLELYKEWVEDLRQTICGSILMLTSVRKMFLGLWPYFPVRPTAKVVKILSDEAGKLREGEIEGK